MPSGSDSVFQWARPARSLIEYEGPFPVLGRIAPSRNVSCSLGTSSRCAPYSTSLPLSLRAARTTALVPTEPKRLEQVHHEDDPNRVDVAISSTTPISSRL